MMGYEKDFIYKMLPSLTKAINRLADEVHTLNENLGNNKENQSESNELIIDED